MPDTFVDKVGENGQAPVVAVVLVTSPRTLFVPVRYPLLISDAPALNDRWLLGFSESPAIIKVIPFTVTVLFSVVYPWLILKL